MKDENSNKLFSDTIYLLAFGTFSFLFSSFKWDNEMNLNCIDNDTDHYCDPHGDDDSVIDSVILF